ncbi:S-adenosyl-L-methionine-dependent methyltransferase [Microthyrium microscopicum]|uniref:S-adenosyl-L-methionine-dependent methyltransferase n=1 Tax=Microthyrium microscopicum TaxID=703497 RepID=A0A6A6UK02_9PEZI|nr:S-adenosyl-L-methionine-dependent methyltransferase [Microthyrium microscopicum]
MRLGRTLGSLRRAIFSQSLPSTPSAHSSARFALFNHHLARARNTGSRVRCIHTIPKPRNRLQELESDLLTQAGSAETAKLELKWLREHAEEEHRNQPPGPERDQCVADCLKQLCEERAKGTPIQLLIGNTYFGDLLLHCAPDVLIPRQDTATQMEWFFRRLNIDETSFPSNPRVLDLCCGSGCMSLLFAHKFGQVAGNKRSASLTGVDISAKALELAERNRQHLLSQNSSRSTMETLKSLKYIKANILDKEHYSDAGNPELSTAPLIYDVLQDQTFDIVLSNPPYIDPRTELDPQVRNFEPSLALFPPKSLNSNIHAGDTFYPRLLEVAKAVKAKFLFMEVGNMEQAERVADLASRQSYWTGRGSCGVQIWRDVLPTGSSVDLREVCRPLKLDHNDEDVDFADLVPVFGAGEARTVVCWTREACSWLDIFELGITLSGIQIIGHKEKRRCS